MSCDAGLHVLHIRRALYRRIEHSSELRDRAQAHAWRRGVCAPQPGCGEGNDASRARGARTTMVARAAHRLPLRHSGDVRALHVVVVGRWKYFTRSMSARLTLHGSLERRPLAAQTEDGRPLSSIRASERERARPRPRTTDSGSGPCTPRKSSAGRARPPLLEHPSISSTLTVGDDNHRQLCQGVSRACRITECCVENVGSERARTYCVAV